MPSAIPLRKIGNDLVPAIGFGAMGISIGYGTVGTDEERLKILDAAYEQGSRHWDTADAYADSEDLIGKWLRKNPEKRKDIYLATKFGISFTVDDKGVNFKMQNSPEYIRSQFNKSLQRLGTDYIDLYYLHRADPETPIEYSIQAMAELVKEGKVKSIGISEVSKNTILRAVAVHPIAALQYEFSPFVLEIETSGLLDIARANNIKIVAYSPLGRGLLTGQIKSHDDLEADDARRSLNKFSPENFPKVLEIVEKISAVGKAHGATPGQVALAWVLAQGDDFFVIPGTKKEKYLLENVAAANVKLTPEEVALVRKIAEEGDAIPGDRFQPGWREFATTDTAPLPK